VLWQDGRISVMAWLGRPAEADEVSRGLASLRLPADRPAGHRVVPHLCHQLPLLPGLLCATLKPSDRGPSARTVGPH
jgi:hypothetical protein